MTDLLTPARRSALMAKVKGSGNASTELRLVAVLRGLVFAARGASSQRLPPSPCPGSLKA
jgi:G:T-mismatch repair DNA endonuclease (very short patch repair protein)